MKIAARKLLTSSLLAIYGGITLLGHGLHWLVPDDGHHHGRYVVRCEEHDLSHEHSHTHHGDQHHHHHHHRVDEAAKDRHEGGQPVVRSNECGAHSHLCEICEFLSQARSLRVQVAASVDWQPVVAAAIHPPQLVCSTILVGDHAPRGPPLVG